MSIKIMSMVFERFPLGGNERLLALSLADHANDFGENIHPGYDLLSRKVLVSERTIIRSMNKLIAMGWLIKISTGNSIKGIAKLYKINPEWVNNTLPMSGLIEIKNNDSGDKLSPQVLDDSGDKNAIGVTPQVNSGDTAMSYQRHEPSLTTKSSPRTCEDKNSNHSITTNDAEMISENKTKKPPDRAAKKYPFGEIAIALLDLVRQKVANVQVTSMNPHLQRWVTEGLSTEFVIECVYSALQYKPWPEKISSGYLDEVIRSALKPKANSGWANTDEGVMAKGYELGVMAKTGESMRDYRERLKTHMVEMRQGNGALAA